MKRFWGLILFLILILENVVAYAQNTTQPTTKDNSKKEAMVKEIAPLPLEPIYQQYIPDKNVVVYSKSSRTINATDPTMDPIKKNKSFPGFRGANQLVIYTRAYGDRTNTNEFGGEAIVKGNVVVAISGADSLIPKDGIVISGHGTAKTWINKNIIVGTRVYIDKEKNSITAYTTSDSYIYGAKECLKEVQSVMKFYQEQDENYNERKIEHCIKSAQNCIKKAENNPSHVQEYSQLAIEYANKALFMAIPYKAGELRGVWLRPTCKTREDVVHTVNKLVYAGINNVFLETYFHGMTIFPSKTMIKYGFTEQNPSFAKFDVLQTFIEECHKKNIKVNVWFEAFYVGNRKPELHKQSILAVCPTWSNVTKKSHDIGKPVNCAAEHNGYFLDPSNPEVHTFLIELANEIITTYKPDGINVDYIRYPQNNAPKTIGSDQLAWGYTCYARNEFKSIYGVDPITITPCDEHWQTWCNYRRCKVTCFVQQLSKLCRANNIKLTAVIFPNRCTALENKHQDWSTWSKNNYIDGFTPLFLTCDPETASDLMNGIIKNKNPKTKLYAGLFVTFMNGTQSDLIRQIHELRKLKLDGFSIFDYAHFNDNYITTLKESVCTPPPEPRRVKNRAKKKVKKKKR